MPIQLLLDWSKALVAIVCSLLLAISLIMCTTKPFSTNLSGDFQANRTNSSVRNDAIESETPLSLPSADAMPLNISLNHDPYEFHKPHNETVGNIYVTTSQQRPMESSSEKLRPINVSVASEQALNASDELILAAADVNKNDGKDNFRRHTSLAKTQTKPFDAGQTEVDRIETTKTTTTTTTMTTTANISNKTQTAIQRSSPVANDMNVSKLIGRIIFAHSTQSPIMQTTTHQSTANTQNATIQSVFLDYATNFNGTKSQQINSINHNDNKNVSIRHTNEMGRDASAMDAMLEEAEAEDGEGDDAILSRTERSVQLGNSNKRKLLRNESSSAERIERSANFSLTKATKRIQLLIKGRILQMLPDGTVNGTLDDQSEYTVMQRITVDVGQIRLIGIATCLYLCMDSCGNLYCSREFTNDCIFNERLENNYNYYTSTHHSTALRTYYLALNRLGAPRKTHLPSNKPLGKLSTYAKAFTLAVPEPRSEAIIGQRFGFNHVKHGIKHLCESGKQLMELTRKQLVYPECSAANGGSSINSPSSSLSKPNHHHIRHANQNHRSPLGPAALTDLRSTKNKKSATPSAATRASNCNSEQCHKKKKPTNNTNNGNRGGGIHNSNSNTNTNNNHHHHHHHHHATNRKTVKRTHPKFIKRPTTKKTTTTTTTTSTTTTTTTESAITPRSDHSPDYDDDADYAQITSNEQTGLVSDDEYEYDE